MKILFSARCRTGYYNALVADGHEVFLWQNQSIHDIFNSFSFDIGFFRGDDINRALSKCLEKSKLRSVVFGAFVERGGQIDYVENLPAFDDLAFANAQASEAYKCDIICVNKTGAGTPLANLAYPVGRHNIRFFNEPVSLCGQNCGRLSHEELPTLIKSAKLGIMSPGGFDEFPYQCKGLGTACLVPRGTPDFPEEIQYCGLDDLEAKINCSATYCIHHIYSVPTYQERLKKLL